MKKLKHYNIVTKLILVVSVSCNYSTEHNNLNRQSYIGKFILNLKQSKLRTYEQDSNLFKGLTLEIKDNDSFYFSKNTPFISRTCGKWRMKSADNLYTAYLQYDTTEYGIAEDHVYIVNDTIIKVQSPLGIGHLGQNNQNFAETLYFNRVNM